MPYGNGRKARQSEIVGPTTSPHTKLDGAAARGLTFSHTAVSAKMRCMAVCAAMKATFLAESQSGRHCVGHTLGERRAHAF